MNGKLVASAVLQAFLLTGCGASPPPPAVGQTPSVSFATTSANLFCPPDGRYEGWFSGNTVKMEVTDCVPKDYKWSFYQPPVYFEDNVLVVRDARWGPLSYEDKNRTLSGPFLDHNGNTNPMTMERVE